MIGLDTFVLVRYVVRDDAGQAASADRLIDAFSAKEPGFLGTVVLAETWWVLGRAYAFPVDRRLAFVEALLESQELVVEDPDAVRAALQSANAGADFADALIAESAKAAGCTAVMTFDKAAARDAGMTLLS